jgi:hypothetical protein
MFNPANNNIMKGYKPIKRKQEIDAREEAVFGVYFVSEAILNLMSLNGLPLLST